MSTDFMSNHIRPRRIRIHGSRQQQQAARLHRAFHSVQYQLGLINCREWPKSMGILLRCRCNNQKLLIINMPRGNRGRSPHFPPPKGGGRVFNSLFLTLSVLVWARGNRRGAHGHHGLPRSSMTGDVHCLIPQTHPRVESRATYSTINLSTYFHYVRWNRYASHALRSPMGPVPKGALTGSFPGSYLTYLTINAIVHDNCVPLVRCLPYLPKSNPMAFPAFGVHSWTEGVPIWAYFHMRAALISCFTYMFISTCVNIIMSILPLF